MLTAAQIQVRGRVIPVSVKPERGPTYHDHVPSILGEQTIHQYGHGEVLENDRFRPFDPVE